MLDGISPGLIEHLLDTRSRHSLLAISEKRGRIVVEGVNSILWGDNPNLIRYKLEALYLAEDTGKTDNPQTMVSATHLVTRLRDLPTSQMSFDELTELHTDMGFLARNEGIPNLAPLIEAVDYPLLRRGIELLVESGNLCERWDEQEAKVHAEAFLRSIEDQLHDGLVEDEVRYKMITAGFTALQAGKSPEEVGRIAREAEGIVRRRQAP